MLRLLFLGGIQHASQQNLKASHMSMKKMKKNIMNIQGTVAL
jgi:hypothetical protein